MKEGTVKSDCIEISHIFFYLKLIELYSYIDDKKEEALLRTEIREKRGLEKMLRGRCTRRMELTRETTSWLPRLEILAQKSKLSEFEKAVILITVGGVISSDIRSVVKEAYHPKFSEQKFDVGTLLWGISFSLF